MSKVQITLSFDTFAEALKVLAAIDGAPAQVSLQPSTEKQVETAKPAPAAPQQEALKPAEQAAPGGVTIAEVQQAFRDYVGRGGGRTAGTGKAILTAHGVASIREAKPEQYQALRDAFVSG